MIYFIIVLVIYNMLIKYSSNQNYHNSFEEFLINLMLSGTSIGKQPVLKNDF